MDSSLNMTDDETEDSNLLAKDAKKPELFYKILSALLALSLIANVALVSMLLSAATEKSSSYETGFASDLASIKDRIELIQTRYTGGVELDRAGHFSTDATGAQYVGNPSKEIDLEWEKLLLGLNLDLTDKDIGSTATFQWPESGMHLTGLEVYHSLHCLNRLRQAIHIEHYRWIFDQPGHPEFRSHVNHCINHIRQALQCHADLTPMEWRQQGSKVILNTDTLHTCRNWDKLHSWATSHRTRFDKIEAWKNGSLILVD